MNKFIKTDAAAVFRGIKVVSEALATEQKIQASRVWRNSSLKPAVASLKSNAESIFQHDGSQKSVPLFTSISFNDISQRLNVVVEGIRQFGKSTDQLNKLNQKDLDFEDDISKFSIEIESSAENFQNANTIADESVSEQKIPPFTPKFNQNCEASSDKTELLEDNIKEPNVIDKILEKPSYQQKIPRFNQSLSDRAKESRVPSSRLGRLASYSSLAAGLGFGALAEVTRRTIGVKQSERSAKLSLTSNPFLTEANIERIVKTLCRVRGAALKLGQMASMDTSVFSPEIQQLFERVRQSADFMPIWQMERVLNEEFGSDWALKFKYFDQKPFAAASIGQVHLGTLHDNQEVAIKIQYPGVAEGISSDISNLMTVMKLWNFLPDGLYMDNIAAVAQFELAREVDYTREAENGRKFKKLIENYKEFYVPEVIDDLCTKQVLTTELVDGVALDKLVDAPQHIRDKVCKRILQLCLMEVFQFKFMQTDPNWSNFFYNEEKDLLMLLDFGACREFDKSFVDNYMRLIKAAVDEDEEMVLKYSIDMGFLTGYEAQVMKKAHVDATLILGSAFRYEGLYDFGNQQLTDKILTIVPTMLKHRLTPPPEETYSLHRKMAGMFLLCSKLNAKFNCSELYKQSVADFEFEY